MNSYEHQFTVRCPGNGVTVQYNLTIETSGLIKVEDIIAACNVESSYHEDLADTLHKRFGGRQTMVAYHHGVRITTKRGDA